MSLKLCNGERFEPLQELHLEVAGGASVELRDGQGRVYASVPAEATLRLQLGGALGTQLLFLRDQAGQIIDECSIRVDCASAIHDESGCIQSLNDSLHYTLESWLDGVGNDFTSRFNNKTYRYFVCWLRDHVHTLKGQKYFYTGELQTAIELYADTQRDDGMIFDRCASAHPNPTWRDYTFREGDFIKAVGDGRYRMERIPVENDVEFLFLEGLYYTWKACGDDAWMASMLDHAIKAVDYATSDSYRWSEQFQLLKRGYTIDTWDFMHADDTKLTRGNNCVDLEQTTFGVMHGDNTGMAVGCEYLAEMLRHAGRSDEAGRFESLAAELRRRLYDIAWNGDFFTHHISEDPSFQRDFGGTDPETQVSLSNAYGLNRNIDHDKCVAIIKTYQRIREEMPESSPGEFYQIYPPFENGFGRENGKWHYMNGGVGTIVAGELAHGAFEHGFESYGFDILKRVQGWGDKYNNFIPVALRGCAPEHPPRTFKCIDLKSLANVDTHGAGDPANGIKGWTDEGDNDLHNLPHGRQKLLDIPFELIDPAGNGRKAVIGLAYRQEGYADAVSIPVDQEAQSLYILHTCTGGGLIGHMQVQYDDGSELMHYVNSSREVNSWFLPPHDWFSGPKWEPLARLAWQGPNDVFDNLGVYAWGWNNPHPEKRISAINFVKEATPAKWFICGITASDQKVLFPSSDVSFGIPDCWGAGAVVYAVMEGIAGVKDTGVAMHTVTVAPRWVVSDSRSAEVTVQLPASDGYVRYHWQQLDKSIAMHLTASADDIDCRILLPAGQAATALRVNDEPQTVSIDNIEDSQYLLVPLQAVGVYRIAVDLE